MKNVMFRMMAIAAVLGIGSAIATEKATLTAQIPFPFRMGATVLPAGDYKVIQNAGTGYVALTNQDTHQRGALLTSPGRPINSDFSKLVFHKYGDRYFLAEVWASTDGYVRRLSPTAAEREVMKAPAQIAFVRIHVAR